MKYCEEIKKHIERITNGKMIFVTYQTELPVRAAFKKQGISIKKMVTTVCRTGVDYDHITSVLANRPEDYTKQNRDWYTWDIENKVRFHEGKGKYYLHVATIPDHSNTRSEYRLINNGTEFVIDKESIREYVIDSYFKNNGVAPAVKDIAFDNIFEIKCDGEVIA